MILLSILGAGDYKKTAYCYREKKAASGEYVQAALCEFFAFEKVLIAMTDAAALKHEAGLRQVCNFEKISIPDGKNEEELWEIFNTIASHIPENAELVLDVTHGFRSLPMMMLSIIIYLQVTKKVSVRNILYGAFDARNLDNNVSPIFELTPFLDIISWSFATDYFVRFGKAKQLNEIISKINNTWYREKKDYKPKGLKNLGGKLGRLSNAMSVGRTFEIIDIVREIPEEIEASKRDVENIPEARPLASLLDKIPDTFGSMIIDKEKRNSWEGLKTQSEILKYYLTTGHYQQAITLARELLVSAVCLLFKRDIIKEREFAESVLNERNTEPIPDMLYKEIKQMQELWKSFYDSRNDINHAGMRPNPASANGLIENIEKRCKEVVDLIMQTGL